MHNPLYLHQNAFLPRHTLMVWYYVFPLAGCVYVCPPVGYDSDFRGGGRRMDAKGGQLENIIQPICNTDALLSLKSRITMPRVGLFGRKHVMFRIQVLFSTIALSVRIELCPYDLSELALFGTRKRPKGIPTPDNKVCKIFSFNFKHIMK